MSDKEKRKIFRDHFKGFINELTDLLFRSSQEKERQTFRRKYNTAMRKAFVIWKERYCFRSVSELEEEGTYLIIPVVPGFYQLKELLRYHYRKYFEKKECISKTRIYAGVEPYFIIDVEDGRNLHLGNKTTLTAKQILEKQLRLDLTVTEVKSLALYNLFCFGRQRGTLRYPNLVASHTKYDFEDWDDMSDCVLPSLLAGGALSRFRQPRSYRGAGVKIVCMSRSWSAWSEPVSVSDSRSDSLINDGHYVPSCRYRSIVAKVLEELYANKNVEG